jgi:hypothetical protein
MSTMFKSAREAAKQAQAQAREDEKAFKDLQKAEAKAQKALANIQADMQSISAKYGDSAPARKQRGRKAGSTNKVSASTGPRPKNEHPLHVAILGVLPLKGKDVEGITVKEITAAVLKNGFKTNSPDLTGSVTAALGQNKNLTDGQAARASRGKWVMTAKGAKALAAIAGGKTSKKTSKKSKSKSKPKAPKAEAPAAEATTETAKA